MKNKKWTVHTRMKAFSYRKGRILSSDIYRSYKSGGSLIEKTIANKQTKTPETQENT